MNFTSGKNYELLNPYPITHILINPNLGTDFSMQIYSKFDLLVDGHLKESPEKFWVIQRDTDGGTFAQPMNATVLSEKIMGGGWMPLSLYELIS